MKNVPELPELHKLLDISSYTEKEHEEIPVEEKHAEPVACSICTLINPPRSVYCEACRSLLVVCPEWKKKRRYRGTPVKAEHRKTEVVRQQKLLLEKKHCERSSENEIEERTQKAREKAELYQKLIELQDLKEQAETEARERRILIRKNIFGQSLQNLTLRDMCIIALIDSCTDTGECMQILAHMNNMMFSFTPLEEHCFGVVTKKFSLSVFDLDSDPNDKEGYRYVDKEAMKQLGVHYHGGREHLVLQDFDVFMEISKPLQETILNNVWSFLHQEDVKACTNLLYFLKGCITPMEPKREEELKTYETLKGNYASATNRKFRFLDFCLWFGFREEDPLIEKILSDGINSVHDTCPDFTCLPFLSQKEQQTVFSGRKGKEPLDDYGRTLPESPKLSPETASWFYDKAFRHHLFAMEEFIERYIKNNWILVTKYSSWITLVPLERREMLEAEYQKEMIQYYQKISSGEKHKEGWVDVSGSEYTWEYSDEEEEEEEEEEYEEGEEEDDEEEEEECINSTEPWEDWEVSENDE